MQCTGNPEGRHQTHIASKGHLENQEREIMRFKSEGNESHTETAISFFA